MAHHKMAGRFATLCIEVLGGQRPPGQLATLTTPEVQIVLGRMARHRGLSRPHLRNWHTAAPTAGVLEVCARLAVGPRSRALALRLEHHPSSEHDTPRPDPRSREGDSAATPGAAAPRTRYRLDARRGGTPRNDIFHGWRCVALQLG